MDGRDYLLVPDRRRSPAGQRPHAAVALHRARAGEPGPVLRRDPQAARQPAHRPRGPEGGLLRPGRERGPAPRARPRRHRRRRHVPLRPARAPASRRSPSACCASTATTCSCPTRSRSTARSSTCSTRWSTSRLRSSRWGSTAGGCCATARASSSAASSAPRCSTCSTSATAAPTWPRVQMQANNGILVIDDFGRQADLTPEALLNRWIVPLDRQRDHLMLDHGSKFDIPFDAKIVFSTNLQPETLGDEAFFRRIQSKVLIPSITDDAFDEVLRRVCAHHGVTLAPGAAEHLRRTSRELGDGDLRPYLPAAVCKILISICTFEGLPLELHPELINRIAHMYFTHTDDRGGEIPVAAGARRPVAIPTGEGPSPLRRARPRPAPAPAHRTDARPCAGRVPVAAAPVPQRVAAPAMAAPAGASARPLVEAGSRESIAAAVEATHGPSIGRAGPGPGAATRRPTPAPPDSDLFLTVEGRTGLPGPRSWPYLTGPEGADDTCQPMSSPDVASSPPVAPRTAAPTAADGELPLRIAFLTYRGKPHVGGQGVYTRHLTKALVRPGPRRRGPGRPALPRARPAGPPGRAAEPRHLQRPLPDAHARCRGRSRASATPSRSPRSSGGTFPEPLAFSVRACQHLRTRVNDFDLVQDNQCLGYGLLGMERAGLPVLATIHHPITVDRRLEMEHAETGWQALLQGAAGTRFTKMQTRVAEPHAADHHGVAELPRRHQRRPRGRPSSACTSCPSASTRSCSARCPTSSASPAGSSPPPAPTSP